MNPITTVTPATPIAPSAFATEGINLVDRLFQAWTVSQQCRVAIRQLKVEERRIDAEYKKADAAIKAETRIRLEQLKNERRAFQQQLRIIEKGMNALSVERMHLFGLIERAQQDGQYEFATACLTLLSQTSSQRVDLCGFLAKSESKLIGGPECGRSLQCR